MVNFDELFSTTSTRPLQYKDMLLVRNDHQPFEDGDRFLITFESTNSEWTQGIALYLFGNIEIENISSKVEERTVFWENTAPKEINIRVWRDSTKKNSNKKTSSKRPIGN